MNIWLDILAIILGIAGIAGSILPVLPGPPISYVGLLLLYFWGNSDPPVSLTTIITLGIIVLVVTILDYFVPAYFTKKTGGSPTAARGALVGMILGIVFTPIGMILGSFLGAFLAELLIEKKDTSASLKSALGSFLGFITGTGMKLICCTILCFYIVKAF